MARGKKKVRPTSKMKAAVCEEPERLKMLEGKKLRSQIAKVIQPRMKIVNLVQALRENGFGFTNMAELRTQARVVDVNFGKLHNTEMFTLEQIEKGVEFMESFDTEDEARRVLDFVADTLRKEVNSGEAESK